MQTAPRSILMEVAIENGKIVMQLAEFSGMILKVKAARNGKPFLACCNNFTTGEGKQRKQNITTSKVVKDFATRILKQN
jgi:hypothetical protein